ncbi:MAG: hypothetical protein NC191_08930 [Muribaculaceae bacterium]|nr:hypothetical protein [Muribaculaceae bacterium]
MCNTCRINHRIETITATAANVVLTVSNDTNISSLEPFNLIAGCQPISTAVTGAPLPVQVTVNGTAVALLNRFSLPILSNRVPRRAQGTYVVPATGAPYVILHTTPCNRANA